MVGQGHGPWMEARIDEEEFCARLFVIVRDVVNEEVDSVELLGQERNHVLLVPDPQVPPAAKRFRPAHPEVRPGGSDQEGFPGSRGAREP